MGRFRAERAGLYREEARAVAGMPVRRAQAPLHQLALERRAIADLNHVADEDLIEPAGERRRIIPHLVAVREYDEIRRICANELFESGSECVRGVARQQLVLNAHDAA